MLIYRIHSDGAIIKLTQVQQEILCGTNSVYIYRPLTHAWRALGTCLVNHSVSRVSSCPPASRTAGTTSFSESSPGDRMETKLCVWRAARCRGPDPEIIQSRRHYLPLWGHKTCQVWVSQSVPTNSNRELPRRVRAVFSAERTLLQDP